MSFMLLVLLPAATMLGVFLWLDERELRRAFEMFGTTGFYDVDQRVIHENALNRAVKFEAYIRGDDAKAKP